MLGGIFILSSGENIDFLTVLLFRDPINVNVLAPPTFVTFSPRHGSPPIGLQVYFNGPIALLYFLASALI